MGRPTFFYLLTTLTNDKNKWLLNVLGSSQQANALLCPATKHISNAFQTTVNIRGGSAKGHTVDVTYI